MKSKEFTKILKPISRNRNQFKQLVPLRHTLVANMSDSKPSLPEAYVVPKVWKGPETYSGINRPFAGARNDKKLQRGEHPLQLYSLGTPNGQKVTIMLEEIGVEYDAWPINIMQEEQFSEAFVKINPNSKIPALLDYSDNNESPTRVFETGSILMYLAEKYGQLIPTDARARTECYNWLFFNIGSAPYLGGGFGHFYHYAPIKIEYAIDRFSMEAKRIVDVLDKHLAGNRFLAGEEYSIADIANYTWVRALDVAYHGKEFLSLETYTNVNRWMEEIASRPAVVRGLKVNGWLDTDLRERHSKEDFKKIGL